MGRPGACDTHPQGFVALSALAVGKQRLHLPNCHVKNSTGLSRNFPGEVPGSGGKVDVVVRQNVPRHEINEVEHEQKHRQIPHEVVRHRVRENSVGPKIDSILVGNCVHVQNRNVQIASLVLNSVLTNKFAAMVPPGSLCFLHSSSARVPAIDQQTRGQRDQA